MKSYREIPNHFSFRDVYDRAVHEAPAVATFVEIGTWQGASAVYMASKIRDSGKQIKFYAVDNFTGKGSGLHLETQVARMGGNFYHVFCDNLVRCGVSPYVVPVVGDSTQSAEQFPLNSLDFVFIDACHHLKKVRKDIVAWLPRVKHGGTIAGHDYDITHPGVMRAVNQIFVDCPIEVMVHSWVVRLDDEVHKKLADRGVMAQD